MTSLCGAGSSGGFMLDDPIALHINVAKFIAVGTVIHVAAHIVHMLQISEAPQLQPDPLQLWALTSDEVVSGTSVINQVLNWRKFLTPLTGVLVFFLMFLMAVTALPCTSCG